MLRLDSTTVLQAVLSAPPAGVQPQAICCFSDDSGVGYKGGRQFTVLTGVTDVSVCDAPAGAVIRDVDYLSVLNRDSASVVLTIKMDVGGTDSPVLTVTLLTLETLVYTHSDGWRVLTPAGGVKTPGGTVTSVGLAAPPEFVVSGSPVVSSGTLTFARVAGTANPIMEPGGRLTPIAGGLPVFFGGTSASVIFYTPYKSNLVPIFDGSIWKNYTFTETSQPVTDNTKSPAATVPDSAYDLFVWNDAGVIRCTRGPVWANLLARGSGPGTSELSPANGTMQNLRDITNGPTSLRGTYVGSVRTNETGLVNWFPVGGAGAGGGNLFWNFWNMYNRVKFSGLVRDLTDSWTYSGGAWRAANNSAGMRCNFMRGLQEDAMEAKYVALFLVSGGLGNAAVAVGLDSIVGGFQTCGTGGNVAAQFSELIGVYEENTALGAHFLQALEYTTTTMSFYGDNGATAPPGYIATGLYVSGWF